MNTSSNSYSPRDSDAEKRCHVCGFPNPTELFASDRGIVCRCRRCDLYFVIDNGSTPPGQESLFYSTVDEERYIEYFRPFRSRQYREILTGLNVKRGSLLDVGASYGWMVAVAEDLGFDSFGLEPGQAQAPPGMEGKIVRESLDAYCKHATRTFDVITIWHVLEHLRDPVSAVHQMRQLLADDGVLVIAVPTTDGWMFKTAVLLQKLGWQRLLNELFYFHNPNMHFIYPNVRSLAALLQRCNLQLVSARTIEAFDWNTIWTRGGSPLSRWGLKIVGPMISASRVTRRENLIIIARKQP